jgi:hypothetical protein
MFPQRHCLSPHAMTGTRASEKQCVVLGGRTWSGFADRNSRRDKPLSLRGYAKRKTTIMMRSVAGLSFAAALLSTTIPSHAQSAYSYPWCAVYGDRSGAQSCYFMSRQQCLTTLSGIGGSCIPSPYYHGDRGGTRRSRSY